MFVYYDIGYVFAIESDGIPLLAKRKRYHCCGNNKERSVYDFENASTIGYNRDESRCIFITKALPI